MKDLLSLLSLILLTACSQQFESVDIPNDNGGALGDPIVQKGAPVCYPGDEDDNELCYQTDKLVTNDEYNYADPRVSKTFPENFSKSQYSQPLYFLDLSRIQQVDYLSKNFQLGELMQEFKGRYALFSPTVITYMQEMRNELKKPIIINSAYRSPAYNSGLRGAAKWSRHMYGDAIDFRSPEQNFNKLKNLCLRHGASFYQIYTSHIHCDWRNTPLSEAFYGPVLFPKFYVLSKVYSEMLRVTHRKSNNKVIFRVADNHSEDEDHELVYKWRVTYNGKTTISENKEVTLDYRPGEYDIRVTVGGSVSARRQIQID